MKELIKKFIPPWLLAYYHKSLTVLANYYYGRPSEKMIVIGVTGTNGKSSTVFFIAKILEEAGFKVGAISTALVKIVDQEKLNDTKMTMFGRFVAQKLLRQMVEAGCQYAIVETSSQGIEQFRHLSIHYDVCVFTNLTPEHIEAHGGFENYKHAKLKLFKHLEVLPHKHLKNVILNGAKRNEGSQVLPRDPSPEFTLNVAEGAQNDKVKKIIVANGDDKYAGEFLDFKVDERIAYSITNYELRITNEIQSLAADDIECLTDGLRFKVGNINFNLKLFGKFNIYNSLAAIAVAQSQGIDLAVCKRALEKVIVVPGRMEFIATNNDFKVLIDYAPEPESMRQLFETIKSHHIVLSDGRIIHVFGSCGGGRDASRRPILGELSAKNAAVQIITNEDPYNDDPEKIIEQVAKGALKAGKILGQNLFKILDRREAIKFALSKAKPGDLVLLTGKGCEQAICVAKGCKLPWDEREVVRELLKKSNF